MQFPEAHRKGCVYKKSIELEKSLALSQAENVRLREALKDAIGSIHCMDNTGYCVGESSKCNRHTRYSSVLSSPTPTEALDRVLAPYQSAIKMMKQKIEDAINSKSTFDLVEAMSALEFPEAELDKYVEEKVKPLVDYIVKRGHTSTCLFMLAVHVSDAVCSCGLKDTLSQFKEAGK